MGQTLAGRLILSLMFSIVQDLKGTVLGFQSDQLQNGGRERLHTCFTSASFVGVLLLQFGQGGAHVGLKLLSLRHQRCIG